MYTWPHTHSVAFSLYSGGWGAWIQGWAMQGPVADLFFSRPCSRLDKMCPGLLDSWHIPAGLQLIRHNCMSMRSNSNVMAGLYHSCTIVHRRRHCCAAWLVQSLMQRAGSTCRTVGHSGSTRQQQWTLEFWFPGGFYNSSNPCMLNDNNTISSFS